MDTTITIISLILTIVIYLIFPLCYKHVYGKVSKKTGHKIALWNSIICCAIFCLIAGIISGGETVVTGFAPAVTYYFITKWILIDKDLPDPIETDKYNYDFEEADADLFVANNTNNNAKTNNTNQDCFTNTFKEQTLKATNTAITTTPIIDQNNCPNCNSTMKENSKYCTQCGLKIEEYLYRQERVFKHNIYKYTKKLNYMSNGLITLIVLLLISIMLTLTFLTTDFQQGCPTTLIIATALLAGIITLVIFIKVSFNSLYKYITTCNYNSTDKILLIKNLNNYQNGTITQEEYINKRKNILQKITEFKYRILI